MRGSDSSGRGITPPIPATRRLVPEEQALPPTFCFGQQSQRSAGRPFPSQQVMNANSHVSWCRSANTKTITRVARRREATTLKEAGRARAEFSVIAGIWAENSTNTRAGAEGHAYCERLIGSMRRECLDWVIPLSEKHLRRILREWVVHHNRGRPHASLGPGIPEPATTPRLSPKRPRHEVPPDCRIRIKEVLGGLQTEYRLERVAA